MKEEENKDPTDFGFYSPFCLHAVSLPSSLQFLIYDIENDKRMPLPLDAPEVLLSTVLYCIFTYDILRVFTKRMSTNHTVVWKRLR